MKVVVEYEDTDSLVPDEVINHNLEYFGPGTSVKVTPTHDDPLSHIYYGIQGLLTFEQIQLFYDSGPLYKQHISELRDEILEKLEIELNRVIIDNEAKLR